MKKISISRATAEHYSWGPDCGGWPLVKDAAPSVIEGQCRPPGPKCSTCIGPRNSVFSCSPAE